MALKTAQRARLAAAASRVPATKAGFTPAASATSLKGSGGRIRPRGSILTQMIPDSVSHEKRGGPRRTVRVCALAATICGHDWDSPVAPRLSRGPGRLCLFGPLASCLGGRNNEMTIV